MEVDTEVQDGGVVPAAGAEPGPSSTPPNNNIMAVR